MHRCSVDSFSAPRTAKAFFFFCSGLFSLRDSSLELRLREVQPPTLRPPLYCSLLDSDQCSVASTHLQQPRRQNRELPTVLLHSPRPLRPSHLISPRLRSHHHEWQLGNQEEWWDTGGDRRAAVELLYVLSVPLFVLGLPPSPSTLTAYLAAHSYRNRLLTTTRQHRISLPSSSTSSTTFPAAHAALDRLAFIDDPACLTKTSARLRLHQHRDKRWVDCAVV